MKGMMSTGCSAANMSVSPLERLSSNEWREGAGDGEVASGWSVIESFETGMSGWEIDVIFGVCVISAAMGEEGPVASIVLLLW